MTNTTASEAKAGLLQHHIETYRRMQQMAEMYDRRGDTVLRDQTLRQADEYADTRLGPHGRKIVGL